MTLPVTVLGGYLGAGKTTLVNHLLRNANGRRLGVLVNEFGTLPIDADLIEGAEGNLLSIAGGCICCSYGDDLVSALMDFAGRAAALDQVLIECSGVALPGSVAGTIGLLQGCFLDAIVVLADAETVRARAADRYMGDTITRQLGDADLIVLNKIDLVAKGEVESVVRWLAGVAPRARVMPVRHAAVAPEILFSIDTNFSAGDAADHHAGEEFSSENFKIPHALDAARLAEALADPSLGLVRAKGFAPDRDGAWKTIQVVGRRAEAMPAPAGECGPGRLVCIAHGQAIDRRRIGELMLAFTDA
jgi:G3E family GTPase